MDPKPTTTDIGSDVTLTCVWVGNPPLTLTWTKKDSNMVNLPACSESREEGLRPHGGDSGIGLFRSHPDMLRGLGSGRGESACDQPCPVRGLCLELRAKGTQWSRVSVFVVRREVGKLAAEAGAQS